MQAKRVKNVPEVHILTQRVDMKFIPEIYQPPPEPSLSENGSSFSTRLKSFLGFSKSNQDNQSSAEKSLNDISKPVGPEKKEENRSILSPKPEKKQESDEEAVGEKALCEECSICEKCQKASIKQKTVQKKGQQKQIVGNQQKQKEQKQQKGCSECRICEACQKQKQEEKDDCQVAEQSRYLPLKLKFVEMITPQFLLIGNKHQLDLINIGNVSSNQFVDTEYYWSFKFHGIIQSVAVDSKKTNVLAIIVDKTLKIYKYDYKKIPKEPFPIFREVTLKEIPFCMTMAKDGNICVFYEEYYEIFAVTDQLRKRRNKRYEIYQILDEPIENTEGEDEEKRKIELLAVPEPYENILNIFFTETVQSKKVFTLWNVELEFQALQIKNSEPRKIYEIQKEYKSTLTLSNYARDIFIMNLRNQINAMKPGYVLDSANIRMNQGEQFLNYVGNDTLLHTSKKMIEVYNFSLNTQVKPSRIKIKAKDSIKIHSDLKDYEFLKILPFNSQFVIIFQIKPAKNKNRNGEVSYCFFLTKGITLQEKINLLFPKRNWNFKTGSADLIERCDMARKMGLSPKEIYLELWNRTEKCKKQDYEILILTNDYSTIKNEILQKLRKASMPFSQIWKIEQECFSMLESRVFNPGCTEEAIMEYISCHFFLRKLEMFKDKKYLERNKKKAMKRKSQGIQQEEEDENVVEKEEDKEKKEENKEKEEHKEGQKSKKKKQKEKEKDLIKMTIRQYQNLRSMEIKSELLNQISIYCDQKKQSAIKNIRFLLKSFKFVFRTIYYELLEEIITKTQQQLYELIVAIPELLPYTPPLQFAIENYGYPTGFFEGVWPSINAREWKESLYVDAITTIDNREIVLDNVLKSLQFRRNYLSQHDMVIISKKQIQLNAKKIKSEEIFFYFISKIFTCMNNEKVEKQNPGKGMQIRQVQMQVIKFLQENYERMPKLIKGKVFLIEKIYTFLEKNQLLPSVNGRQCTLTEFLKFKDEEFIKHCFVEERSIKGLILKQIKPLYEQVCGAEQGKQLFNEALLHYFISNLSQVSDLKYILNRINNENKQFHYQNQKMYEILVEALERKLKIGTGNDIPIQEVLIYIENIPFKDQASEQLGEDETGALSELQKVQNVNEQVDLLQRALVNMSVYDILYKPDEVITKLVVYLIKEEQLVCQDNFEVTKKSKDRVTESTNFIMSTLKVFSEYIYGQQNQMRIFFIYLTKLCEKAEMIKHACHLFQNKHLNNCFDQFTANRLVQYLFKYKMSEEKIMVNNQIYVNELLQLLPPGHPARVYIESQMKYAQILSRPDGQGYEYPISEGAYTIVDLRNQLLDLPIDYLTKINLEELHKVIVQFQQIQLASLEREENQRQFTSAHIITLHQMYEIIIIQLLHARKLKEVLEYIKKIFQQDVYSPTRDLNLHNTPKTNYNIVYPILYIIELSSQLTQDNKNALISSISYYFYHPWDLLKILDDLCNNARSPREIKEFLEDSLARGKRIKRGRENEGYNPFNGVFNQSDIEKITNTEERADFMRQLSEATRSMQESKEQFKDIKYAAIMAILCNSPYALAKLIICSEKIDVSAIRCFLSYAIREKVFNPLAILELGRRIFQFLLLSELNLKPVQLVIDQFQDASLLDLEIENDQKIKEEDLLSNKLLKTWYKSAQAFRKKKQTLEKERNNQQVIQQMNEKKSEAGNKSFVGSNIDKNEQKEYPFSKIDHDNEEQEIVDIRKSQGIKKGQFKFDPKQQINIALENKQKINLFGGNSFDDVRNSGKFTMSIRGKKSDPGHFFHSVGAAQIKQFSNFQPKIQQIELADSHKIYESLQSPSSYKSNRQNEDKTDKKSMLKSIISDQNLEMESEQYQSSVEKSEQDKNELPNNGYIVNVSTPHKIETKIEQCEQKEEEFSDILDDKGYMSPQEIQQTARNLIETNMGALENSHDEFDFSKIESSKIMQELAMAIYKQKPNKVKSANILKMIKKMTKTFPQSKIPIETLDLLSSLAQRWEKIISDIPFTQLLSPQNILREFQSKGQLFQVLSHKLYEYSDSENIYKVGFFVRGFDNPDYESLVYWDMIMNLCETLDNLESEEVQTTLQKIEGILKKANVKIWNQKFDLFLEKVLPSNHKQKILYIFCEYLKEKGGSESEALHFLEELSAIETSTIVEQTLKHLM